MDARKSLQAVLRALTDAMATLSEVDCERVLSGHAKITISVEARERLRDKRTRDLPIAPQAVPSPCGIPDRGSPPSDMPSLMQTGGADAGRPVRAQAKHERKSAKVPNEVELISIAERVRESTTREAALEILHEEPALAGRDSLACLAKLLMIHVTKNDDREAIVEKIVEFTVGAKLRVEAIRGLNLKRTGNPTGTK